MDISLWCDCYMTDSFGSLTVVESAGSLDVLSKIGESAGQIWVIAPLSRTASLCFYCSTEVTDFEFEETKLIKSKLTRSKSNYWTTGLLFSKTLIVSSFVAFL